MRLFCFGPIVVLIYYKNTFVVHSFVSRGTFVSCFFYTENGLFFPEFS